MPVISVDQVTKSYRGRPLYRDITFDIPEGSVTALVGPNGSGKSVLFRLLCGFTRPDHGSITIDPRYLSPRRTFPEHFGILIDRPGHLPGATGLDNLRDLARIRNVIGDPEIRDTMQSLGLDPSLKQKVRHYSLGMKQKLSIAQALMEQPKVLILDEPFNALDTNSVHNLKKILRNRVEAGTTLVFTSHDPQDITDLATRRLRIDNERVHLE